MGESEKISTAAIAVADPVVLSTHQASAIP